MTPKRSPLANAAERHRPERTNSKLPFIRQRRDTDAEMNRMERERNGWQMAFYAGVVVPVGIGIFLVYVWGC